jgi:FKBP-type peptidyl-prolyl cis-trans isomerase (trigger factor)
MPYKITHRANHTVEVEAELDAEAVASERSTIVQAIRSRARVPGFRPGKAPVAAVRARFGDDIRTELEEQLTGRLLREVFDGEDDLHPITHPRLRDVSLDDEDGFRFTAEMEVRPHYELVDPGDLELPEVSLDVSEVEVDAELANVAEEHGTWEPVDDEAAVDGMLVEADLHGVMEDSDERRCREPGPGSSGWPNGGSTTTIPKSSVRARLSATPSTSRGSNESRYRTSTTSSPRRSGWIRWPN